MTRMTPIRWLILIAGAAGMYVVFLLSTSDPAEPGQGGGRRWLVPQQVNSLVLTALTASVLCAAHAELSGRRDARRDARLYAHLALLGQQLDQLTEATPAPLRLAGTAPGGEAAEVPPDNVRAFELGREAERRARRKPS